MRLINGNVLVEESDYTVSVGGILFPMTQDEIKIRHGIVKYICQSNCPFGIGDEVFFPLYIKQVIDVDGKEYALMKTSDVLAYNKKEGEN